MSTPAPATRATRAQAPAQPAGRSEARVDERVRLDRPQFGGSSPPSPWLGLRIVDRSSPIALAFSIESPEWRENSLYKIDTLLGVLHRFRAGLKAEAELYASRELDAGTPQRTFDIARLAL